MTAFGDLAVELLLEVASYLDLETQANLRTTSKLLQSALDPSFFSVVFIPSNRLHLTSTVIFLYDLGKDASPWSKYATALVVGPALAPLRTSHRADPLNSLKFLTSVVSKLKRIKRIRIDLTAQEDPELVYDGLCNKVLPLFPSINHFELKTSHLNTTMPPLSNLSTLKVHARASSSWRVRATMAAISSADPGLVPGTQSRELAPSLSDQVVNTLSRSPNLRVLHLADVFKLDWSPVWRTLQETGARPTVLTIDRLGLDGISYLKSCSGLEELVVVRCATYYGHMVTGQGTELARMFFREVLPQHSATLKTLRCPWESAAGWTLNAELVEAISVLRSLTRLEILTDEADLGGNTDTDAVHLLLQLIRRVPSLQYITLQFSPDRRSESHKRLIQVLTQALDVHLPLYPGITLRADPYREWLAREGDRIDDAVRWYRKSMYEADLRAMGKVNPFDEKDPDIGVMVSGAVSPRRVHATTVPSSGEEKWRVIIQ
uniref:F-box domain-containing protein n=1 Tax=Mycena chlorophos TaxID=658473 RepID=A0ABQ0LHM7_MYCCL|nr:predicted protein [Mycena chlorophos]